MTTRYCFSDVLCLALLILCFSSCERKSDTLFSLVPAEESGILFNNRIEENDTFNILTHEYIYNGGGVGVADFNNDGLQDIFFTGNLVPNKLYLNKGNLEFEDITEKAGVAATSSWKTGSVMGDVNGDGLLDIYVCAVVGLKNLRGHNELFINNGPSDGKKQ